MTVRENDVSAYLTRIAREPDYLGYSHWCPGCRERHVFWLVQRGLKRWSLDNLDFERPSFSPSMRVFDPEHERDGVKVPEKTLCHYLLKEGVLNFLPDSKHALAGTKVPLPPLSEEDAD